MRTRTIFLLVMLLVTTKVQAGVATFLHEKTYGDCKIKITHEAAPGEAGVLKIRSRSKSNQSCPIQKQQLREVLFNGMVVYRKLGNDSVKPGGKAFKQANSIFLGRIKNYPWISDFLVSAADKGSAWNNKTGRPAHKTTNQYVSQTILAKDVLFYFDLVLEQVGLQVAGASCEKVLINKDRLPYDAMCWLEISR